METKNKKLPLPRVIFLDFLRIYYREVFSLSNNTMGRRVTNEEKNSRQYN